MPEPCGICGERVPLDATVHLTINTKSDAGVLDQYVCRSCYEAELAPLVE